MASAAKVLSSPQASATAPELRGVRSPRRVLAGWLQLVREAFGGALLLVAWLALWSATWAAVAGPLSPVRDAPPAAVEVRS